MAVPSIGEDILFYNFPQLLPAFTLIIVLALFIGFWIASPHSFKYLFSNDWMDDYRRKDMMRHWEQVEKVDRFEKYGLTKREKQVASLLLDANTVRMISGELKISESTVKMHTSNLYKKIGINSRVEMFRIFGVSDISAKEQ
jgi:DNA-binding CsgD family transcriptional regulator